MTRGPFCPACGCTPYDAEEETCGNPRCANHWTRLLPDPKVAMRQREAALYNQTRRVR